MACCMADKYKWCADLQADISVEEDGETKDYCLFHAPKESKCISVNDFHRQVFAKLKQAGEARNKCDLSGTIFLGEIDFKNRGEFVRIPFSFSDATFTEKVSFSGLSSDKIDFTGATFEGEADFSNTSFNVGKFIGSSFLQAGNFTKVHFNNAYFTHATFSEANFQGTYFNNESNFESVFFKNADFSQAEFMGITFAGAEFQGACFRGAMFKKECDFTNSKFHGVSDFQSTHFQEETVFDKSEFERRATFENAMFRNITKFNRVSFKDVTFNNAHFTLDAYFDDATVRGNFEFRLVGSYLAYFKNTVFKGETYFNGSNHRNSNYGNLGFSDAEFEKNAYFNDSTFGKAVFVNCSFKEVDFQRSIFKDEANFYLSQFNEANFDRTEFKGNAIFDSANFKKHVLLSSSFMEAFFRETAIYQGSFEDSKIERKIVFEDVDLSNISFLNAPVEKMEFITPTWNGRDYYVLRDEITARSTLSKKLFGFIKERLFHILPHAKKSKLGKAGVLYNKLKQKYKESHNEAEASKWHYGEKEMLRLTTPIKDPFQYIIIHLYWLSSGYAELPVRSGLILVLLLIVLSALFGMTHDGTGKDFGQLLLNTVQYATFEKKPLIETASTLGMVLKIVIKLLIPVQTALLVLAIRNRFRR